MRNSLAVLALAFIGACFCASAYASEVIEVEVHHPQSNEETVVDFARILQPTHEDAMFFDPILADRLGAGSHFRIQYESYNPVPIEVVPWPGGAPDVLSAVLPASNNGDVLLPIYKSAAWSSNMNGVLLKIYGLNSAPPSILRLGIEDNLSFIGEVISSIRHPFVHEGFSYYVMSELAGYRFRGTSVVLMLGVLLSILVCAVMFISHPQKRLKHIIILCLCFIFIYQARFLVDLSRYTVQTQRSWWGDHQLGHMGDVYAIASKIQEKVEEDSESDSILLCTNMLATPLRHLVHPIIVEEPMNLTGQIPKYAIVTDVWNEAVSSFQCGDLKLQGSVLHLFSDGKALIQVTP